MRPRTRLSAKEGLESLDAGNADCSPSPAVKGGNAKKRKITDTRAQPELKGSLKLIVDMPVDVLLEIFKHLGLVDLMELSRTSTALRSILMSRNSISVWKQVVANAGLPSCTEDLNEPQLAELIFGRSCDWCGSERNISNQKIIWVSRVRACTRCIQTTFESQRSSDRGYPVELVNFLPSVVIGWRTYFDESLDRQWRREYAAKRSKVKKLQWLDERLADRTVISEHAKACEEWFRSHLEARVSLRKEVIIERLRKRGWKEELDKLGPNPGPTDTVKEVLTACQSELTEPILAGLDRILDKFMENVKTTRLHREKRELLNRMLQRLQEIFKEYSCALPASHILPNTADIYLHPTVHTALSAVESRDALEEVLATIQPSLSKIVDDCLQLSKSQLANLVIEDYTKNNKSFDPSVLTLASTLFHCSGCNSDLTLDQTVVHGCRPPSGKDQQHVFHAIREVATAQKVSSMISFSLARLEPLVSVLHSCGIDPNITAADLSAVDPILECLDCSNPHRGRVTMRWLSVTNHFRKPGRQHQPSNVSVLDEAEAEIVRARMLERYQRATSQSKDHICVHCRHTGGSMTLIQHVKQEHHIGSPVYGQDIIVSPSAQAPPSHKVFNLWPPRV